MLLFLLLLYIPCLRYFPSSSSPSNTVVEGNDNDTSMYQILALKPMLKRKMSIKMIAVAFVFDRKDQVVCSKWIKKYIEYEKGGKR